jgi:hypothetical protein
LRSRNAVVIALRRALQRRPLRHALPRHALPRRPLHHVLPRRLPYRVQPSR